MIMKWTLRILALLCAIKVFLEFWGDWTLWSLQSQSLNVWSDVILWPFIFALLAVFLFRQYKVAMVFVLFFSFQQIWDFRDMGGSPLLIFTMGIQAQCEMIELLLAILLSTFGVILWIYQAVKQKKFVNNGFEKY